MRPLTAEESAKLLALQAERDKIYAEISKLAREMTRVSGRINELESVKFEREETDPAYLDGWEGDA